MPPLVLDILKYGFLLYLSVDLIRNLRTTHNRRLFTVTLWVGWKKLVSYALMNIVVLTLVLGIGTLIWNIPWPKIPLPNGLSEPALQFSWLQLLASKEHPEAGGNLMVSGAMKIPILGVFFFILLLLNL